MNTMKNLLLILSLSFLLPQIVFAKAQSEDGRYKDLGNGIIEDSQTGLMWMQKDSYIDLGHSVNWDESNEYVNKLATGGYTDWRLPTISELKSIFEPTKKNKDIYGGHIKLDAIFAAGGTYNYWSSETVGDCCAQTMTFDYGHVTKNHREFSGSFGVRAVRK